MKPHPHDLLLQEFASTLSGEPEELLEHLISCDRCQQQLRPLLHSRESLLARRIGQSHPLQVVSEDYGPALARASQGVVSLQTFYENERAEAEGLLSELLAQPTERRILLIRNSSRFQTLSLCQLLLRRSREQNFQDATLGESLAVLAHEVLEVLDSSFYGAETLEDLRAQTWAYIANSRRIKGDLRGAEQAFALAFAALAHGSRDPMERAVLLDLRASLLRAQRRFDEALRLLHRATRIFLQLGERHRAGRALLSMSTVHHVAGEPEKSIPLLYQAFGLIDPDLEPRLQLVVWHNLIHGLAESNRFMEAQKLLVKARPLYRQFPRRWSTNPRRWVEGKIARGLNQLQDAEALLLRARDGFLAEDAAYDVALVSLDLASLYAQQGRRGEVKRVAEEMMPIFSSRQIHREALAALAFWKQAVDAERIEARLVNGVAAFLKRARYDPELRFQQPQE